MRVRTRRFEKLRSCESGYSKFVEVFDGEDAIQTHFAMTPPVPGTTSDLRCQLVICPERTKTAVNSRPCAPALELDGAESMARS
jgi:hypothetical protein